jgi:truncated hemoglobin YjbI
VKTPTRAELARLIESIGGEVVLRRILSRFYEEISHDLLIGFFFDGRNLQEIASQQALFILFAAGLIQNYGGRRPGSAHSALPPILSGHFDRRLVLLREVLHREGLSPDQIDLWVRFEESFRGRVVTLTPP